MDKKAYAIIESGGKQLKVSPGDKVDVDFLDAIPDKRITFDKVLMIVDGDEQLVGKPAIENAKVIATCLVEGKEDKIIVFKYKSKVRYRNKRGHRQLFTKLEINDIIKPDGKYISAPKKTKVKAGGIS
jgi:large subunit ribosomal protein L21